MADVIESASSGRAKCRGCGQAIQKGTLRFGEALPNPFAEGETRFWFHLSCAACMRSEKVLEALESVEVPEDERVWLERVARSGIDHPRLRRIARAERSPSGRANCRYCRSLIDKGGWRIALQLFEEGRAQPIGFVHIECTEPYFGTPNVFDRVERLTIGLGAEQLEELKAQARVSLAKTRPPSLPGIVKVEDAAGAGDSAVTRRRATRE